MSRPRSPGLVALTTLVLVGLLFLVGPGEQVADAQTLTRPGTSTAASASPNATSAAKVDDEEAPDSPRASLRAFQDLCDRGRYEEASRYLDVPRGAEKRSAELARKLRDVLAERLWVDVEHLSTRGDGKSQDGLPAGVEELGKIKDAKGHTVAIRIVRHEPRGSEDEARWVFAQSTVQAVDALYASLQGQWLREKMPDVLEGQGPKGIYWWQWLALPVLAALCLGVGGLLTFVSAFVARRLTGRVPWAGLVLERLAKPVTLAWSLLCFWLAVPYLGLTLRAEDLLERLLAALAWLAFFWALLRAVAVLGDRMLTADWALSRPSARAFAAVSVKLGKVVVAALALMVALSELGYPVTSVIAGLGVGGIALALAAQKTVENLFGSLSILADQPFRVGDVVRVDTVEGTVESIGLRSTRLRTVDRTLIVIPNGKLADMRIETLGARDRIRFSTKLQLHRDTAPEDIRRVVELARKRLESHPKVVDADVYVRFSAITDQSADVELAVPVATLDASEFAAVREELLLALVALVREVGVRLAEPRR